MKYIREYNSGVYKYIKEILNSKFNVLKHDTEFLEEFYNVDIWVYLNFISDNPILHGTEISIQGFDTSEDFSDQIAGFENDILNSKMELEIDIEVTTPTFVTDFKYSQIDKETLIKISNFYDKQSYIMKKLNELYIKHKTDMDINYRADSNDFSIMYKLMVDISEMTNMIKNLNK